MFECRVLNSILCWPFNTEGLQGQGPCRCTRFRDRGLDVFPTGVVNRIVSVWARPVAGDGFWSLIRDHGEKAHNWADSWDGAGGSKAFVAETDQFAYVCKSLVMKWPMTRSVTFINPSLVFSCGGVHRFEWGFSRDDYLWSNKITGQRINWRESSALFWSKLRESSWQKKLLEATTWKDFPFCNLLVSSDSYTSVQRRIRAFATIWKNFNPLVTLCLLKFQFGVHHFSDDGFCSWNKGSLKGLSFNKPPALYIFVTSPLRQLQPMKIHWSF